MTAPTKSRLGKAAIGLHVNVTRKQIQEAYRLDARKCAIAEAIIATDEDIIWANVRPRFIEFARSSTDMIERYRTPGEARQFIEDFDNGGGKPFYFDLEFVDFVSMMPRHLNMRERADEIARRAWVTATTGKDGRNVPRKELPVFDSNGAVIEGKSSRRYAREIIEGKRPRPAHRALKTTPGERANRDPKPPQVRQYAKRSATEATRAQ